LHVDFDLSPEAEMSLDNAFTRLFVGASFLALIAGSIADAQESPQPGTVVFSQNICPYENITSINAIADSVFTPILDELLNEGRILGWGILTHAWGDEWNWNVYYTVESHRAFLDFWAEYIARLNARHPGLLQRFAPLCTEHKDNIYSVRVSRPGG
jgi:hypothetical protein